MAAPLFIFGGNTGVASPKELKRLRAVAEALSGSTRAPKDVGEGLNAIGQALLYRSAAGKADRMEQAGLDSANETMNPILKALGGGGSSGGKVGAALMGQPGASAELASTDPAPDVSANGSTFEPFMSAVQSAGLTNPNGLAAVAATGRAESGWSPKNAGRTWSDPSESGQAGTAGGVMSWRAERLANLQRYAASKGEEGNGSPQTQAEFFMQEDPQLIARLNSAKSPEEAQQIMNNAWRFAGFDRPGGEAGRRLSYANAYAPQFQGQGAEVASLDPSAGMPPAAAAIEQQAPGSGYVDPMVSAPNYDPQQAAAALPQLPSREVGPAPQMAPPPPQQAPQQVAQAESGLGLQQLYQALQNPWLNEGQQQIILGEIERIQQQNDPVRQLELQKLQREIDAPVKRDTTTVNGRLVDAQTGQVIANFPDQEKPTNDQRNYEYYRDFEIQNGRQPLGPLEWEQAQRKAGATTVNTNIGEGDKFYENLDKKNAETFSTLSEGGMTGRSRLAQLNNLETIMREAPTGAGARVKLMLGDLGINTEGLSDLQATRSLLEKMVPEQRAAGSGPMSDADIAMYRRSLPDVINQPGGNELIFGTAKAIAQYDIQMGEIADMVADREITPAEGRKRIRELKNPLDGYAERARAIRSAKSGETPTSPDAGGQAPEGVDPGLWQYMTPEERKLWQ
jgi:hypothetical protein